MDMQKASLNHDYSCYGSIGDVYSKKTLWHRREYTLDTLFCCSPWWMQSASSRLMEAVLLQLIRHWWLTALTLAFGNLLPETKSERENRPRLRICSEIPFFFSRLMVNSQQNRFQTLPITKGGIYIPSLYHMMEVEQALPPLCFLPSSALDTSLLSCQDWRVFCIFSWNGSSNGDHQWFCYLWATWFCKDREIKEGLTQHPSVPNCTCCHMPAKSLRNLI